MLYFYLLTWVKILPMPKTIDYPRTSYLSAWEVAEVVDDTGGKCSIEACARKLNRKVSGSFKAILGSAVKFGLLISKREMLTTTNLFRRIKNAYDKAEEKIYHREAFLHPPLFSHICRKFRNRELPVHMFDVMLVREFDVEEINAQSVAKAFVEGARMVDLIDERNIIADIDQLTKATPRRPDLASPEMGLNIFRTESDFGSSEQKPMSTAATDIHFSPVGNAARITPAGFTDDAISSLFGLNPTPAAPSGISQAAASVPQETQASPVAASPQPEPAPPVVHIPQTAPGIPVSSPVVPTDYAATAPAHDITAAYTIRISGPGLDTQLSVQDESDLVIVQALLEKIRKHVQRRG
jgi:hypothetical protein